MEEESGPSEVGRQDNKEQVVVRLNLGTLQDSLPGCFRRMETFLFSCKDQTKSVLLATLHVLGNFGLVI